MRYETRWLIAGVVLSIAAPLHAQTTGMPSYNAPYRAFERSELGAIISFPRGGGTAFEGAYRRSQGQFDVGVRAGIWDPSGSGAKLLLGGEARQRVITHTQDFPLDGALVAGIGASLGGGNSALLIPVGISMGRRVDLRGSSVSIVPYAQPTAVFVVANGDSDFNFTLGLGTDFRLSRTFDARLSVGIGDIHGISIAAVWVH